MESLCKRMVVSISLNTIIMKLTMFSISFPSGPPAKWTMKLTMIAIWEACGSIWLLV